jgi:hypothetical protein
VVIFTLLGEKLTLSNVIREDFISQFALYELIVDRKTLCNIYYTHKFTLHSDRHESIYQKLPGNINL